MENTGHVVKQKCLSFGNVFFIALVFFAILLGVVAGATFASPQDLKNYIADEPAVSAPAPASAYTTSGTPITNESQFKAIRRTATVAYLANDITLTSATWEDSTVNGTTPYSGTLYGNGKTITIAMSAARRDLSDNRPQYIGLLFGYLSGTVRDCTVRLTGSISYYEYSGSDNNFLMILGIICGQLQGGTVSNVNVIVDGYFNSIGRDTGGSGDKGGTGALVGAIAGSTSGGTIQNCTVINNNSIFGATEDDHGNDDEDSNTRICVGGFVGEVNASATLNMTNIAINGASGSVIGAQVNYNTSGNGHNSARAGGIIGAVRTNAKVNITDLDYKFKGYIVTCASNSGYGNFIVGRGWGGSVITISNVKFSNFVYPKILKSNQKLSRQDNVVPSNFNKGLGFSGGIWPFTSGYTSGASEVASFDTASLSARMYASSGTVNKSNFYLDDGAVDYIIYNNTSESAAYTVLAYDGIYNTGYDAGMLWSTFHGASGSTVYYWNSNGFNVRLQLGLGEAYPLNMFGNTLALLGNGTGKTLYLTGNAIGSGVQLFILHADWSAPNVVFNLNASCAAFPIYDATTIPGGSITIAGGNLSGSWLGTSVGVVHMVGVTPLTITGGTITNNGTGEAVYCNNSSVTIAGGTLTTASGTAVVIAGSGSCTISGGSINSPSFAVYLPANGTLNLSGGTLNAQYGVVCDTNLNAFYLSGAPAVNGTAMDFYIGKTITASNVTGTYTLNWIGNAANGTTIVTGNSTPARFPLANSGYALYPSGSNLKLGKVSPIAYYGVSSTSGLVTTYIESYGATLTAPTASNIANGFTYAGMYTSSAFTTSTSSVSASATNTVNIFVKKTLNYSMSSTATSVTYGDADITLGVSTSASSANLTYAWTKGGTAYANTATVVLSEVSHSATYAVTATYTEKIGEFTLVSTGPAVSKAITISKRALTISGVDAVDRVYNKTTTVSLTGGTLVNYKDGNGTAGNATLGFTLGTGTIPTADKGTHNVTVNIALTGSKAANYTLTQPTYIDVVISPKSLTSDVSFGSVAAQTFTGLEIKPEPSAADSLQTLVKGTHFTYSYQNNVNAGTGTIIITGTGNYTGTNSTTFTINKKNISSGITIASITSPVYSGSANTPSPAVTYSSVTLTKGTESTGDYWLTYTNNVNAGTATLTVNGRGNYTGTLSANFTILKADVTLSIGSLSDIVYGQTIASSVITGTAKNTQFSSVSVAGTWAFVSPTTKPSAGTASYAVKFTPSSTANYNTPGTVSGNLTTQKCVPTLTNLNSTPVEYKRPLSTSAVNGTATNGNDASNVPGSFAFTNGQQIAYAGVSYEVTFFPADTANYAMATAMLQVNILKRLIDISYLEAVNRVYDATTTIDNFVWSLHGVEPDEEVELVAVGSIASPAASAAEYNVTILSLTLTGSHGQNYRVEPYPLPVTVLISPRTVTVNARNFVKHYGDADPVLEEQISSGTADGLLTVVYTRDTTGEAQNAGVYSLTSVALKQANANYNVLFATNGGKDKFTVLPFDLAVTASVFTKTYGEPNPLLIENFEGAYGEILEVMYMLDVPARDAGSYSFSEVALTLANGNYEVSFAAGGNIDKFVIYPYILEVTATTFSKTYSEQDPLFIQEFYGTINEIKTVIFVRDTVSPGTQNVGTYSFIDLMFDTQDTNYELRFAPDGGKDKFTIYPYYVYVNAKTFTKHYGQADPSFVEDIDCGNGDVKTVVYTRDTSTHDMQNAGVYSFTALALAVPDTNYVFDFTAGGNTDKFTILPFRFAVTAAVIEKTYGNDDPVLEETLATGIYGDSIKVSYTRAHGEVAAAYDLLTIALKTANSNYTVEFAANGGKDKFVIVRRIISVTALDTGHIFGDPDVYLTYTTENMKPGDTLNGSLERGSGDTAGVYRILQGTLSHPDYEIASYTEAVYTVYKKPVTVTAHNTGHIFGDNAVPLTFSNTALVTGYPLSVTLIREDEIRAGQYPILAENDIEADNPNYEITFIPGWYTIARRPISVYAYSRASYYGDPEAELTYIAYGTSPLAELTGALVRDRADVLDAGTYDILQGTLDNEHNPDYDIAYMPNTYTIHKRIVAITPVVFTKVYGEDDPALMHTLVGAYGEPYTVTYRRSQPGVHNVGAYSLVEIIAISSNNYAASIAAGAGDGKFVITRKAITVTASDVYQVYGEAEEPLVYEALTLAYDETTLNGAIVRETGRHWREEGYAILQGSVTNANNPNYDISFVPGTYHITKRPVTLTADNKSQVYGQPATALTYRITAGNLVDGDAFSGAIVREEGNTVREGGYTISAGDIGNPDYEITFVNGVYTITPADLFIAADEKTITYGEPDVALTYRITAGLVGDDTLSGEITRIPGSAANEAGYDILAGTLGNPNYTVRFTSAKYIILRRVITLTAEPKTQVYGDSPVPLTYLLTEGSLVNDDTLTGALTRDPGNDYREEGYGIRIGTVGNGNYSITFVSARYMITRRPVTVTAEDKTQVYGDDAEPLTYIITEGNLIEGDTLYRSLSRSSGNNVGTYNILIGSLYNNNYDISFAGATYTIVKRPITVTADNITVPYGDTPVPTYTVSSLAYNDSLHGAPVLAFQSDIYPAGEYDIVQGTLQNVNNPNYLITFVPGVCTVSRRSIVVTLLEQQVIYNMASSIPDQNAFIATDATTGSAIASGLVRLTIMREPGMFIGEYALSAVCGNPNYEATIVSAVYRINKMTTRITVDATDVVIPYTGIPYSIAASITSKVAPIFTVDGVAVENAFTEVGTYVVTVSGEGTDVCLPPPTRTVKITILPVALETENGGVTSSDGYSGNSNFKIVTASPFAAAGNLLTKNERFAATYDITVAAGASGSTLRLQVPEGIDSPTVKVLITENGVTRVVNLTQFDGYVTFDLSGPATVSFVLETHPFAAYLPIVLSAAGGLVVVIIIAFAIRKRYRY